MEPGRKTLNTPQRIPVCSPGWTPWLWKDCAYMALTWSLHYIHLDLFTWHFRYIYLLSPVEMLAASSAGLQRSEGKTFLFLKRGVERSMRNQSIANPNKPWACSDASAVLTGATRVASLNVWLTLPGEAIREKLPCGKQGQEKAGERGRGGLWVKDSPERLYWGAEDSEGPASLYPSPPPSQDVSAPFDGSSCPLSPPAAFHSSALSTPYSPPRYLHTKKKKFSK